MLGLFELYDYECWGWYMENSDRFIETVLEMKDKFWPVAVAETFILFFYIYMFIILSQMLQNAQILTCFIPNYYYYFNDIINLYPWKETKLFGSFF